MHEPIGELRALPGDLKTYNIGICGSRGSTYFTTQNRGNVLRNGLQGSSKRFF